MTPKSIEFKYRHMINELVEEVMQRVIIPRETAIFFACGILAEFLIILRGGTGTGKSTIAKYATDFFGGPSPSIDMDKLFGDLKFVGGKSNRVQCTFGTQSRSFLGGPDIGKLTAGEVDVVFRHFITKPIRLWDEAGRLNPYVWADVAQLLAEQEVDIEGVNFRLPRRGVNIFTMNPPSATDPANSELPPFILSRANMKLSMASPTASINRRIARKETKTMPMPKRYSQELLEAMQDEYRATVTLSLEAEMATAAMVRSTTYCKFGGCFSDKNEIIESGIFPMVCNNGVDGKGRCENAKLPCAETNPLDARAVDSVADLACALAYFHGRAEATVEDVKAAFSVCIEHRLNFHNVQFTSKAQHVVAFVDRLYANVSDCVGLAKNPAKVTLKRLEELKAQGSQIVKEIIPDFEEEILKAAAEARKRLTRLTTAELETAKGNMDTPSEIAVIDKMIAVRHIVKLELAKGVFDSPQFRACVTTPEGETYLQRDELWDDLSMEGMLPPQDDTMLVGFELRQFPRKDELLLTFESPHDADEFIVHWGKVDTPENAVMISPYQDIKVELDKVGFQILEPVVKEKPAEPTLEPAPAAPAPEKKSRTKKSGTEIPAPAAPNSAATPGKQSSLF